MGDALRHAAARLRHEQAGIGLIEVIVSALMVVLVASGTYLGLDAASATSGINKHRSVASGLAQQDEDRMRAMAVTELSNYRDSQTATVGGVTYTIVSKSSWITDGTGTASCTSASAQANYLRISSSVTWPKMTIPPVVIESVVAPPNGSFGTNQGSLAVQVRDRNGAGVPGTTVTLTGPQGYSDVTNSQGCVLWGYLPVGNYTVSLLQNGYVDPQGVTTPSKQVGVVGEATSTVAFDYDVGGLIEADYQTWDGSNVVPANGTTFTALTSHLTVPLPPFGDGQPHTAFTSGLVFPFTDPYAVYAGNCAGADPQASGQPAQLAQVLPGATVKVGVREPPINVKAMRGGLPEANAIVKLTGTGSGCAAMPPRSTGANGLLPDPAFPYGPYNVCVQDAVGATTFKKTGAVNNNAPTGVPVGSATFDMTSATAGTCP